MEHAPAEVRIICGVCLHSPSPREFWSGDAIAQSVNMPFSPNGVDERAFEFLCAVIYFVRTIRSEPGIRKLVDQLVAAAGSIAANRQEACSASSRREFVRFNEIALRGAKESGLWLRACKETGIGSREKAAELLAEVRQLARILGSIVVRTKASL